MTDYEPNFDFKSVVGKKALVYLNDYTEVKGTVLLIGFRDKTIVIENFVHYLGEEIFKKGAFMIIKENWLKILLLENNYYLMV